MNILIIDDHPLFREGLQFLLSDLSEGLVFNGVSGVTGISNEAIDEADLILLDLHTVDSHGLQSLSSVRNRNPPGTIVVISSDDDIDLIRDCIKCGAAGFIPKTSEPAVLVAALRLILAGGIYLPPTCATDGTGSESAEFNIYETTGLTRRQLHALLLVAKGKANKSIAEIMNISEGTVKLHLSAAFKTLGVRNRTEAVFALSQYEIKESDISE